MGVKGAMQLGRKAKAAMTGTGGAAPGDTGLVALPGGMAEPLAAASADQPPAAQGPAFSDDYWRFVLECGDQGVWDYDIRSGARRHFGAWRSIRGYGPDDTLSESDEDWLQKVHPADRALAAAVTEQINSGQLEDVAYEYRERHKDGHWVWIMCRGRAAGWDAGGRPVRYIGTDTDITRIKLAEEEGSKATKRLELALQVADVGVWEFDIENDRLTWDARLRMIYGLPATGPLPRDIWERSIHPDDFERVITETVSRSGTSAEYELDYRIIRRDKQVRWIRSKVSYHDGLFDGPKLIGVNWDVTELVEKRRALEAANALALARNAQLERAHAELEHISMHDAVTGLPNRRRMDAIQAELAERGLQPGQRPGALHIDLDRFKEINDTLGHAAGDFILRHVAGILQDCVDGLGTVARIGGDEFVIFIPDAPQPAQLVQLADRIIQRCAQPVAYDGQMCRFGVSIGIALGGADTAAPDQGLTDLFVQADIALYRAKNDGRGRARFFRDEMRAAAILRRALQDDLIAGLERGEIVCAYQPQFDSRSLQVSGLEALVRWQHPERGLLLPGQFMQTAEDLRLLPRIDAAVMQMAQRDVRYWQRMGIPVPGMSVNLSLQRLQDPDFQASITAAEPFPCAFAFELLESSSLDTLTPVVKANIAFLRDRGLSVEVDDFGSGHASLVGLLRLKPDRIKIDQALIALLGNSVSGKETLRAIIGIGKMNGAKVLAEGIEHADHIRLLRDLGCDDLQGYGLARPMLLRDITQFLASRMATRD